MGGNPLPRARHVILHRAVLRRSLVTAVIVGTILTGINHGDEILRGAVTGTMLLKIALTYCVPFCVSTSGALGAAGAKFEPPTA